MKSTLKVALLATVLMTTPVLANDMTKDTGSNYNSQHVRVDADGKPIKPHHWHKRGEYYNSQRPAAAASLDDADRMNGSDSRMYHDRDRSNNRWMGMNATTRGMKAGDDSDMNNRSQHAFIFGNSESHVTKH